jgi:NitT/TauT family transport system substrate-binding protein
VEAIALEKRPLVVIGSLGPAKFAIFTSSRIQNAQDLKGKRFGVSTPGASQDRIARRALSRLGLEPEKDIEIVYTGFNNSSDRLKALARGELDAVIGGMEHYPHFPELEISQAQEIRKMIELSELGIYISGSDIAAARSYIESHRETLSRFLRALEEALTMAKPRPDLVQEAFRKHLGLTNPEIAKSKGEEFDRLPPPEKPAPDKRAIQSNVEELQEKYGGLAPIDVSAFIDDRLI